MQTVSTYPQTYYHLSQTHHIQMIEVSSLTIFHLKWQSLHLRMWIFQSPELMSLWNSGLPFFFKPLMEILSNSTLHFIMQNIYMILSILSALVMCSGNQSWFYMMKISQVAMKRSLSECLRSVRFDIATHRWFCKICFSILTSKLNSPQHHAKSIARMVSSGTLICSWGIVLETKQ